MSQGRNVDTVPPNGFSDVAPFPPNGPPLTQQTVFGKFSRISSTGTLETCVISPQTIGSDGSPAEDDTSGLCNIVGFILCSPIKSYSKTFRRDVGKDVGAAVARDTVECDSPPEAPFELSSGPG